MSSLMHEKDWLGTSGEWGLTPHKHGELCDELSDHLSEMARVESHGAAQDAKETLSQPQVRRKLAGVHLADQVVATLNRMPNRKEWFELAALGLWYMLIIVSDQLSLLAYELCDTSAHNWGMGFIATSADSPNYVPLVSLAWLLQGVARGGFYASFFGSLWRAWRIGSGVCLARILQLKLVHTVLVIGAFFSLGDQIWDSWFDPRPITTEGPIWFTAPFVLVVVLVGAAAVLVVSRGRSWVPALGLVLMAIFLYPSAPVLVEEYTETSPLAIESSTMPDGRVYIQPSTDRNLISQQAAKYREWHDPKFVDETNNRFFDESIRVIPAAGTYWTTKSDLWLSGREYYLQSNNIYQEFSPDFFSEEVQGKYLAAPVSAPGSALGWIAAPIPLLGVTGLVGLLFLMGRRGIVEAVIYSGLVFFALASTIFPFIIAHNELPLFDFSVKGLVMSPCPGFEGLLVNLRWEDDGLLVFGLVLSAAIPWLLTSLFLRPGQSEQQADGGDGMQEAG